MSGFERDWEDATNKSFADDLIAEIKELKDDCEVKRCSEIYSEIGRLTCDKINQTFEDLDD